MTTIGLAAGCSDETRGADLAVHLELTPSNLETHPLSWRIVVSELGGGACTIEELSVCVTRPGDRISTSFDGAGCYLFEDGRLRAFGMPTYLPAHGTIQYGPNIWYVVKPPEVWTFDVRVAYVDRGSYQTREFRFGPGLTLTR